MNRLTLGAIRPLIARVLGVCDTDSRIVGMVNEAQSRMMSRGKWVGSTIRYRICARNNCITWPRQVVTIEAFAICSCPRIIRDRWYEFLQGGYGLRDGTSCSTSLLDRDMTVTFDQPEGSGSVLNVLSFLPEAPDLYLIVQGYDWAGNWIRTLDGSAYIDGEKILIKNSGTLSIKGYSRIVGVIKPVTAGPIAVYEYLNGVNFKELAFYESDETLPVYRQSYVPGIEGAATSGDDEACAGVGVTAIVRLRHIPVVNDNDFLILGNEGAFKLAAQAILKEERNLFDEAQRLWEGSPNPFTRRMENGVFPILQAELSEYRGDGVVSPLAVTNPSIFGAGSIEPVISRNWGS